MGRPLRTDTVGTVFHIVNRGVAHSPIFLDDRDRLEFERLFGVAAERHGISVVAYCWMSNHYHALVVSPDGVPSESMHLIGSVYVRHFNERHGRDGPLFRSRFYARPVRSDAYLWQVARYIHRNPLAFLAVDELVSYRWSSLRTYAGERRPPAWLRTDQLADGLAPHAAVVRAALGASTSEPVTDDGDWHSIVRLAVDEHLPEQHGARAARTLATLLLDEVDPRRKPSLEAILGFPSPAARKAAAYRARRRRSESPELVAAVETALDLAA